MLIPVPCKSLASKSPTNLAIAIPTAKRITATKIFGIALSNTFNTLIIGAEIERMFNVSSAAVMIGIKINTYTIVPNTFANVSLCLTDVWCCSPVNLFIQRSTFNVLDKL